MGNDQVGRINKAFKAGQSEFRELQAGLGVGLGAIGPVIPLTHECGQATRHLSTINHSILGTSQSYPHNIADIRLAIFPAKATGIAAPDRGQTEMRAKHGASGFRRYRQKATARCLGAVRVVVMFPPANAPLF
jgi:hypothetical protein